MGNRYDWLIAGGEVVGGDGVRAADVAVVDGRISEVGHGLDRSAARTVVDATGKLVFPGIIDAHNHPYYHDDIEAFSFSAAHGGVTTLLAFAGRPIFSPVSDVVEMVDEFIEDGQQRSYIDFGLHVILTAADDVPSVVPALHERGITSFKVFMAFGRQQRMMPDDRTLDLMQRLAELGSLCMVHCENGHAIEHLEDQLRAEGRTGPEDYVASRPAPLESEAVYRALALSEVAGCDVYIVHISAAESMKIIERYRERPGPQRYAETCPHYLVLEDHDQVRIGGQAKISPPMRTHADRDALWDFLARDVVDVVASDCSGQTCASKLHGEPDIFEVKPGIPGVEQLFPLVFDEGHRRDLALPVLARVFCERPADIFGLSNKGRLLPGKDADIAVFDPTVRWTVRAGEQHGNSDYSLYEGRELLGRAVFTMQRGTPVLRDGEVVVDRSFGQYLPRVPTKLPTPA